MKWFYFRDKNTGVEVRWDKDKCRVRIIDPIDRLTVDETGISWVRVIRQCTWYLERRIDDEKLIVRKSRTQSRSDLKKEPQGET